VQGRERGRKDGGVRRLRPLSNRMRSRRQPPPLHAGHRMRARSDAWGEDIQRRRACRVSRALHWSSRPRNFARPAGGVCQDGHAHHRGAPACACGCGCVRKGARARLPQRMPGTERTPDRLASAAVAQVSHMTVSSTMLVLNKVHAPSPLPTPAPASGSACLARATPEEHTSTAAGAAAVGERRASGAGACARARICAPRCVLDCAVSGCTVRAHRHTQNHSVCHARTHARTHARAHAHTRAHTHARTRSRRC